MFGFLPLYSSRYFGYQFGVGVCCAFRGASYHANSFMARIRSAEHTFLLGDLWRILLAVDYFPVLSLLQLEIFDAIDSE